MRDNESKQWTNGLNEVQYSKNARYHRGIKRSPYRAMFSNYPSLGVQSLRLDGQILDKIQDIDDLEQVLDQQIQNDPDDPNEQAIRLENMNDVLEEPEEVLTPEVTPTVTPAVAPAPTVTPAPSNTKEPPVNDVMEEPQENLAPAVTPTVTPALAPAPTVTPAVALAPTITPAVAPAPTAAPAATVSLNTLEDEKFQKLKQKYNALENKNTREGTRMKNILDLIIKNRDLPPPVMPVKKNAKKKQANLQKIEAMKKTLSESISIDDPVLARHRDLLEEPEQNLAPASAPKASAVAPAEPPAAAPEAYWRKVQELKFQKMKKKYNSYGDETQKSSEAKRMKYILDSHINQLPSVTPAVTPEVTPEVTTMGDFVIEEDITDEYIPKPSNAFEIIADEYVPKPSDEVEIEEIYLTPEGVPSSAPSGAHGAETQGVNQNEINGNSVISNILTCVSCNKDINAESTTSCNECTVLIHSTCISENGLCQLCERFNDTKEQRRGAKSAQVFQCEDMKERSAMLFRPVNIDDTVLVPVEDVDRSKLDPPNLHALVSDVIGEIGYKLAVTSGVLKDIILSIHQQIFYQDQY